LDAIGDSAVSLAHSGIEGLISEGTDAGHIVGCKNGTSYTATATVFDVKGNSWIASTTYIVCGAYHTSLHATGITHIDYIRYII
jgi:hypothetical protein